MRLQKKTRGAAWMGLLATLMLLLAACGGEIPATGGEPQGQPTTAATIALPSPTVGEAAPAETTPTQAGAAEPEAPAATEPAATDTQAAAPTQAATATQEAAAAPVDCTSPAEPTPAMSEGPYFKPNSPERTSMIEADTPGERLMLTGYVLTTDCQPVPGARLEFWQTDGEGNYDNAGFRMRGHQFTDENGRYTLETVVPGEYPGRTQHIHFKVEPPSGEVLTSQLFVPGAAGNESDRIFDERLLMDVQDGPDGKTATFIVIIPAP